MGSNDELKEVDIKNRNNFADITKIEDFDFLLYGISCKTFIDAKLLRIRFVRIDRFIRVYDGIRY